MGCVHCEGERHRDRQKERFSIPLCVIRVSLGRSLSHFHLCLLTCGRLLGRGRNRESGKANALQISQCLLLHLLNHSAPVCL